jgi:hypothetical protein
MPATDAIGHDHTEQMVTVRLDERLKLVMSKSLRALNEQLPWSASCDRANGTASLTCPIAVPAHEFETRARVI